MRSTNKYFPHKRQIVSQCCSSVHPSYTYDRIVYTYTSMKRLLRLREKIKKIVKYIHFQRLDVIWQKSEYDSSCAHVISDKQQATAKTE